MPNTDLVLAAHLMRRAGFGATRSTLEELTSRNYADIVDELLHPEAMPRDDEDLIERYYGWDATTGMASFWIYRMTSSPHPLEEKIALFWHHVFATAFFKSEHIPTLNRQLEMFRRVGLGDLRTILVELSKDPAMIFWLDNNENFNGEPNENYGRELLELFSMGVGNYSEDDIKMAARAFTGWTFEQPIPLYPHGHYDATFLFNPDQHDDSVKTFLGQTGPWNGQDIVDIVVKQPATANFICRHLYNFFVADEPQVPAWQIEPPGDPAAIQELTKAYFESDGDIRSVLHVLFNSDFFQDAKFKHVKSPAELVTGILKLVDAYQSPAPGIGAYSAATGLMGQQLMNPPTVEGWHTGKEWIDGGTLNERVNFAVNQVGDPSKPGIAKIINRMKNGGAPLQPKDFVDRTLDLVGPLAVGEETRAALMVHAQSDGDLQFGTPQQTQKSADRTVRMLQLIVSSLEYQFG
jgi:uncharacterized protein (DUF1800 family)